MPVNNTSKGLIENSHRESNYEKADKKNLQGYMHRYWGSTRTLWCDMLRKYGFKHTSIAVNLVTSIWTHYGVSLFTNIYPVAAISHKSVAFSDLKPNQSSIMLLPRIGANTKNYTVFGERFCYENLLFSILFFHQFYLWCLVRTSGSLISLAVKRLRKYCMLFFKRLYQRIFNIIS